MMVASSPQMVIEIPDSYDQSRNNPNSVAITVLTAMGSSPEKKHDDSSAKKQSKQLRVTLFIILYSCYLLKRRFLYFFGLGSILLVWGLLIGMNVKESKWIYFVTNTLVTGIIGTGIWILKDVILKVLTCLYDKKFFDKIQDLIFQQDILQTLLGVPAKGDGTDQLKLITNACVNGRRFFILCDALNKTLDDDGDETLINQEVGIVASQILKNLKKNELRGIHEEDLLQVMKEEEVPNVLKLFEGAIETKVIDEASLQKWMVKILNERKTLVHLLSDTNTELNTIIELNTIMSGIVLFLVSIIWLCFMGFATNRVLVVIVTLVVFLFGTTWSNISGGIIFTFLQRPFDIGDCCVVDNEQMIVENMGIWQIVFSREDNEKLYCPTASLLTKSIIIYNGSSEIMEILVEDSTSNENIADLMFKINEYVKTNPKVYKHHFYFLEKEDGKEKYGLHITYDRNLKNYEEKNNRRSELILELKKSFEQLGFKYFSVRFLREKPFGRA